jgi:hypothetical protein
VSSGRGQVGRILGFSAITIVFAVVQPFLLVGVPLALLLIAHGPHGVRSGIIATAILVMAFLGDRSGLWWFERGWALVLAGMFVWTVGWRPTWSFSAQALAALGLTIVAAAMILAISPSVWLDVDALMTARAGQSAQTAAEIVGTSANDMVQTIMQRVVAFQVLVFPALLGVSSIGALGLAVLARAWLRGDTRPVFGMLRSFRFNDHLVWLWLLGLGRSLRAEGDGGAAQPRRRDFGDGRSPRRAGGCFGLSDPCVTAFRNADCRIGRYLAKCEKSSEPRGRRMNRCRADALKCRYRCGFQYGYRTEPGTEQIREWCSG